ncbi:SDR family NAD(P)-dependent oxidoreductase [Paracoccus litorisediminis]|uniref:SDR family oxidoreductase n=1 Tax=Paracoccus litorisediminis TaxID=2006130 RepID=A0A844HS15_9RHOB|nr:SDR family oxidoreductase [Paracoccus litorisediminis]MTH60995.1 SDR family oxidoreductase [Paracoccus litorisediminis]
MTTSFDFRGTSVLVTGASRGIGYGVATGFARAGADLTILAEGEDVHAAAAQLSQDCGVAVRGLACDITSAEAVAGAVAQLDRIDVLVNNAGLELLTPLEGGDALQIESDFRRIVDINVTGTFLMTRAALPLMTRPGANIVNTCSIWSRTSEPGFAAYASSKHASLGLTRTFAKELGPRGIRVNGVCPGWVRTVASMRSLARMSVETGRSEADLLDEIVGNQILPGLMEPEDMAATYLFLASDAAKNITGQAIMVDRGEVLA